MHPQLSKEQAIKVAESNIWRTWTAEQKAGFQLFQQFLCMDYAAFQDAVRISISRTLHTTELDKLEDIKKAFLSRHEIYFPEEIMQFL